MNVLPGFVYSADMLRQAAATESWVKASLRRKSRSLVFWRSYAAGTTVLLFMASGSLNYALPLIRLVPVFFYQKPDGVTETAITTESLPAELSDANIKAWLWQYVQHREGYSWIEADYNHHVVEAMSSVPVREAFDKWYNGKNPDSYLAAYGRKGIVRVSQREITRWEPAASGQLGRITFHFDRQVEIEGEPRQPVETWTVSLAFVQDYTRGFNLYDIKTFNPSRIVVTAYPGSQPLPAVSGGIQGIKP